jgi:SNF2 family DNA or RNA helicase
MKAARSFEPSLPAQLTADLRPYQAEGYQWLARLAEWGVGACLADDMGLGKTVQALAVLLARAERGPALVVAPTSVCFNWVREAERFAPSLRPVLFREGDRAATLAALGPSDLLVCSWGLLVGHAEPLAKVRFATLVLDEAQAIKNPATRRARAARDLSTEWRVALSGTPLENHLGELWSLFRVVAPGLLGSWESFRERFASPIERDRNPERLAALSRVVRPFILRRTKDQVAKELPARTEVRQLVTLSAPERQLYDDARIAAVARLAEEGGGSDQQKRFEVLAALTRLRQLACHPKLYDPASSVPSSKLSRFMEIVAELKDNGHRALVFSQFTSHLALVREALDEKGVTYLYLDGQTPVPERVRRVDAFQAGQADLFLISLKAGGTGLNLTAADYVVHLDPWWNPSVEDQATDRAHRIGQVRPVTVYRLVSKGTIEEAILALHEEKRDLVAGVLDGAGTAAKLTNVELIALIRAGEGAPDVERGEEPDEDESNDEAELQASEAVAGGSPPAPAGDLPANPLRWIADDFRAWLRVHAPGSSIVKAYPRAIERFLGFAHQKLGAAASDARLPLVLGLADAYRDALESGAFPAPKSEPIAVHSALGKLRQFAEEDGDDAGP